MKMDDYHEPSYQSGEDFMDRTSAFILALAFLAGALVGTLFFF